MTNFSLGWHEPSTRGRAAHTGARGNAQVRAIERAAAQRGVILRRDLDGIRPTGGAR